MANTGLLNALQLALGGAVGGLEGYGRQQDRLKAEADAKAERERQARLDEETRKRQTLSDTLAVINAGGMERGARQQALTQAAPAAFDTAKNAMAMMRNEPFLQQSALPAPVSQQGVQSMQDAAGQFGAPLASFDVGGKTFDITQTPLQRSMMLAEQEAQRGRKEEADKRATLKAEQDAERGALAGIMARARKGDQAAKDELLARSPQAYEKLFPNRPAGRMPITPEDKTRAIIIQRVATFANTMNPETGELPTEDEVRQHYDMLTRVMLPSSPMQPAPVTQAPSGPAFSGQLNPLAMPTAGPLASQAPAPSSTAKASAASAPSAQASSAPSSSGAISDKEADAMRKWAAVNPPTRYASEAEYRKAFYDDHPEYRK